MTALYLGLISGTSADGIDVALLCFEPQLRVLAARSYAYAPSLRQRILHMAMAEQIAVDEVGHLDAAIGQAFAEAALALVAESGVGLAAIRAVGSHGQTVRHRPLGPEAFTLQLGDPHRIAEALQRPVVSDFRRRDMAAGGQGAPLVPAFHAACFAHASEPRAILNLGGIGNYTLLIPGQPVRGFDTGPANCLMDLWMAAQHAQSADLGGAFAAQGRADSALLAAMLADPYFAAPPPKSTGREYFHRAWLDRDLAALGRPLAPADVQASLLLLSARSIAEALAQNAPLVRRVIACGGGVHNPQLMGALGVELQRAMAAPVVLESSQAHGLDPDFVEAAAFAWLARAHVHGEAGNCPAVTGAAGLRVLGSLTA